MTLVTPTFCDERSIAPIIFGDDLWEFPVRFEVEPEVQTAKPLPRASEEILPEFLELAERWAKATAFESSISRISMHPDYQKIIALGPNVIPLILRQLKQQPGHWFWALDMLTQGKAVLRKEPKNPSEAARLWLEWGEREGHL
jgi:hypothetical protein